jgi:diadenosine tetraphosphate (Ap4A) HIT family hydrolase
MPSELVFSDDHFTIESVPTLAGYLIIRPRKNSNHLADLPPETLSTFGPLLARAMSAIEDVVHPERIYIIRFGEEVEALHFHLFPRTKAMADLYRLHHPNQPLASGAQMFDWARREDIVSQLKNSTSLEHVQEQIHRALMKGAVNDPQNC